MFVPKALTWPVYDCDVGSTQTFNMKALEDMCGSSENDRKVTHDISSKKPKWQAGVGRWEQPSGYRQVGVARPQ